MNQAQPTWADAIESLLPYSKALLPPNLRLVVRYRNYEEALDFLSFLLTSVIVKSRRDLAFGSLNEPATEEGTVVLGGRLCLSLSAFSESFRTSVESNL